MRSKETQMFLDTFDRVIESLELQRHAKSAEEQKRANEEVKRLFNEWCVKYPQAGEVHYVQTLALVAGRIFSHMDEGGDVDSGFDRAKLTTIYTGLITDRDQQ